ncbi:MAG TPA: PAS domain-containing sensor histidine kinase [Alphaproteobacteria bacterium]|nr:PAS domain-containing sensor histidine kinase [Alphaproteobacteria bacterium]
MGKILNSLVISATSATQAALEDIMQNNIEGYTPRFTTVGFENLVTPQPEPDLVFINNVPPQPIETLEYITGLFAGHTQVLLDDDHDEDNRRAFMKAGVDEVMSIAELQSPVGRHLLEKLLALKDLADAEALIEQSEERFRGIIEHAHDMIILLDADGTVLYTSPAFGRQMGYDAWEVLGQTIFDFVHDSDRYIMRQNFNRLLAEPNAAGMSLEFQMKNKAGVWRNLEAIGSNLLSNVTVQAVVFNFRDVTEQKQAEGELEKYRRHLEELIEKRTREAEAANQRADTVLAASPDTLIAIDSKGCISFMSQHYFLRYPKSAPRLHGLHILDAFDLMADEVHLSKDDQRYIQMREWWKNPQGTREFRLASGMWVRLQARRMASTGEIVVSTTDISEYKRQQALLAAQSAELASALEKEKDVVEQQRTFISMVSHEFRTPLTIIDGNAQIILSRGATLPREMLERRAVTIRSAVERLIRLIETLLSAHMIESGKLTVEIEDCNLAQVIEEACTDQQDISPSHQIKLSMRDLPPVMRLDGKVIRQMMANLLSNAVKYSPQSPLVEVMAFAEADSVVIEVTDYGVGIPEDEQPRIFGKYFRASTSGGIPGSGLGLSLVKQFVELHNGSISLRSKVGVGTALTVTLPLAGVVEAQGLRQDAETAPQGEQGIQ